jgi:hypothetical protein
VFILRSWYPFFGGIYKLLGMQFGHILDQRFFQLPKLRRGLLCRRFWILELQELPAGILLGPNCIRIVHWLRCWDLSARTWTLGVHPMSSWVLFDNHGSFVVRFVRDRNLPRPRWCIELVDVLKLSFGD